MSSTKQATKQRRKRTLVAYSELFRDPSALFQDCNVTLFPNGANEIWIKSKDGRHGFSITAGEGPAGLGMTIRRFIGTAPLTATGNLSPDSEVAPQMDFEEISVCQYNADDRSQQFKKWYGDPDNNPYPKG